MRLASSLSWSLRGCARGARGTASFPAEPTRWFAHAQPLWPSLLWPKPSIPERLPAHVQAFPCFPLPSSLD